MNAYQLVHDFGPLAGGLATGALPWLKIWLDRNKAKRQDKADLIKIAQEAAGDVVEMLRGELTRLEKRVGELEAELTEARKEHADMVAAKDAKITLLEGEVRHWRSVAESYERKLTDAVIPHAKPGQSVVEAKEGGLLMRSEPPTT